MQNLMTINEIYSGYGKENILKGVSLNVAEGDLVGIIGPNGFWKNNTA